MNGQSELSEYERVSAGERPLIRRVLAGEGHAVDPSWEKAIKQGDFEAVCAQLDRGTNVDALDRHGQTGLMLAAVAGHYGVAETLVEHGADLNVTAKYGLSALMLTVVNGHTEIARLLVRAGADLSLRGTGAPGFANKTASDLAEARGLRELARELETKV